MALLIELSSCSVIKQASLERKSAFNGIAMKDNSVVVLTAVLCCTFMASAQLLVPFYLHLPIRPVFHHPIPVQIPAQGPNLAPVQSPVPSSYPNAGSRSIGSFPPALGSGPSYGPPVPPYGPSLPALGPGPLPLISVPAVPTSIPIPIRRHSDCVVIAPQIQSPTCIKGSTLTRILTSDGPHCVCVPSPYPDYDKK